MKRWILLLAITSILNLHFLSPAVTEAQENPVSLIVAGETPGFDPPTTYLNIFSTLFYFLPLLHHNRSLQEPFVTNQDKERGEVGTSVDYQFMSNMIFNEVNAFSQFVDPYDDPEDDEGKELILQYIDEFFDQFPLQNR